MPEDPQTVADEILAKCKPTEYLKGRSKHMEYKITIEKIESEPVPERNYDKEKLTTVFTQRVAELDLPAVIKEVNKLP